MDHFTYGVFRLEQFRSVVAADAPAARRRDGVEAEITMQPEPELLTTVRSRYG